MWYSKEEASEKYPGVTFYGDVWIEQGVEIGQPVFIGKNVRIEQGVVIDPRVFIGKNAWIEQGVVIGKGSVIEPRTKIRAGKWVNTKQESK